VIKVTHYLMLTGNMLDVPPVSTDFLYSHTHTTHTHTPAHTHFTMISNSKPTEAQTHEYKIKYSTPNYRTFTVKGP
jgi:hypothetical protein